MSLMKARKKTSLTKSPEPQNIETFKIKNRREGPQGNQPRFGSYLVSIELTVHKSA